MKDLIGGHVRGSGRNQFERLTIILIRRRGIDVTPGILVLCNSPTGTYGAARVEGRVVKRRDNTNLSLRNVVGCRRSSLRYWRRRRGSSHWLCRCLGRSLRNLLHVRIRVGVGVGLWWFDWGKQVIPQQQNGGRGYQRNNESLLLLH